MLMLSPGDQSVSVQSPKIPVNLTLSLSQGLRHYSLLSSKLLVI